MTTPSYKPKQNAYLSRLAATLVMVAGLLAACSSPITQPTPEPTDPGVAALTLSEPTVCAEVSDCTLMIGDGAVTLAGTVNVPVADMSYTLQGTTDQVISTDTPVALNSDAFNIDLSDLPMGGYTVTLTLNTTDGQTLAIVVVVVVNPSSSGFTPDELNVYVSNNGPENAGLIDTFDEGFELQSTFSAGNNEGVEVDRFGNVYQAGDTERGPSIRIISQLYARPENAGTFDPALDREIKGDATGLVAPKGLDLAEDAGLLIAADFGDGNIKVFDASDSGNVSPVATTRLDTPAWDVAYDPNTDRLFAAITNGTVAVFDNYFEDYGANGPERVITPYRDDQKISANLHGIAYDSGSDTLVVTDVGAATTSDQPGFKTDGSIYAFVGASTLDGNVDPDRVVRGRWTLLGNPVDVIFNGYDEVRITEKANDVLLIFDNFFAPDAPDGEVMPDLVQPETKPESLVAAPMEFAAPGQNPTPTPDPTPNPVLNPDVTDIDDAATEIDALFAVSNTPDSGNDFVVKLAPDLSDRLDAFDTTGATANPENLTFDGDGDGYVTFDNGETPSQGGILVVNRLATSREDGTFDASEDRVITGNKTGLVAPKGLDVVDSLDVAIVADFGAKDIKVFSTQADGNAEPLALTSDLGGDMRSVWDLDYDPLSDTLFVAGTDGVVLVYEDYSSDYGADGPERELTPSKGGDKVSSNLHGIVHVASQDLLILADVGAATTPDQSGFDTDGALYILTDIAEANGSIEVTARVRGPNTTLGNPVDITFDGSTLFVAEKTKDKVLAFDELLDYDRGDWNIKPSTSAEVDNAESVALAPAFLSDQ